LTIYTSIPVVRPSDRWALDDVLVTPHAAALSARENEQQLQSGGLGTAAAMVAASN
jgi:phosphoglycerate dehydrogenase-like enzyme